MFSPAFVRGLQRPPMSKEELARRSGFDAFTLCRISAFLAAVERRDPRAVKLARALGLAFDQAYTVNGPDPRVVIAEVTRAIEAARR